MAWKNTTLIDDFPACHGADHTVAGDENVWFPGL